MYENTEFTLSRDCEAIQIPSGKKTTIPAGTQGVINGSMGFNEETLEPTYQLRLGLPGKSAGLEIATKLGMPGQPELSLDLARLPADAAVADRRGRLPGARHPARRH